MLNLDPAKLLVIAVVAVLLLGPDRLPQVARQVGAAWRSFNEFRHRMESEVRSSIPDLPSSNEIARLARSPSALLNHLSNMSADGADNPPTPADASDQSDRSDRSDGVPTDSGASVSRPVISSALASDSEPGPGLGLGSSDAIVPGDPGLN
jgi:TatA/E family protein of Tat protein translocase